jgi:hypothetical protein
MGFEGFEFLRRPLYRFRATTRYGDIIPSAAEEQRDLGLDQHRCSTTPVNPTLTPKEVRYFALNQAAGITVP